MQTPSKKTFVRILAIVVKIWFILVFFAAAYLLIKVFGAGLVNNLAKGSLELLRIVAGMLTAVVVVGLLVIMFFVARRTRSFWKTRNFLRFAIFALLIGFGGYFLYRNNIKVKQFVAGFGEQVQEALSKEFSVKKSYVFPDSVNQISVPLDAKRWSGWITTPLYSWYDISPPESGYIEAVFRDGTRIKQLAGESMPKVGIKRGILRLRGTSGVAEVVIKRR